MLERDSAHGCPYEVPKGWCGFGLVTKPTAKAEDVFRKWAVSFHGCPKGVMASVLKQGELLMPGDKMIDGKKLPNRLTGGGEDRIGFYTSPSIRYSELDIYTKPEQWKGHNVRTVLQCRQNMNVKPPELRVEGETIGWVRRFGDARFSQYFSNSEIERFTQARGSIIPYRVLVGLDIKTREQEEEEKRKLKEAFTRAVQMKQIATEKRAAAAKEKEKLKRAEADAAKAKEKLKRAEEKLKRAEAAASKAKEAVKPAEAAAAIAEKESKAALFAAAERGDEEDEWLDDDSDDDGPLLPELPAAKRALPGLKRKKGVMNDDSDDDVPLEARFPRRPAAENPAAAAAEGGDEEDDYLRRRINRAFADDEDEDEDEKG